MTPARDDPTTAEADPLRVLLVAPTGRDAALACRVLIERGAFDCVPCADTDRLCSELAGGGAGAIVIADEALNSNTLALVQNNPQIRNIPEGEEARQIIGRQTRHLARLVDDLLDVSRITSGKIVLQATRVNLAELATNAVRAVETWAGKHRHRLL